MRKKQIYSVLIGLVLFAAFYICNRLIAGIETAVIQGSNIVEAINSVWTGLSSQPFWLSTQPKHILASAAAVTILLMVSNIKLGRHFREGEEYGSARWGNKKDITPFVDPVPDNNVLLTQTESLTMESRCKDPEVERNKNVIVIGGSGSGKTRFYVKPNLMQCHSSYVVTDPKGLLLGETGKMLEDNKYVIHVLNVNGTNGLLASQHYNPLAYVHSEADILKLIDVLMENTNGEGKDTGERFWKDAERLFYAAIISYIKTVLQPEEQNLNSVMALLSAAASTAQTDDAYASALDVLFEALEEERGDCFAVRQYRGFKLAPAKTAKSILISCAARLSPFDIAEVRELVAYDELELDKIGDRKTAMFVITSATDKTYNFIAAIMYSQMFDLLCNKAEHAYGGRLITPVRFLLDEFANIGKIPNFDQTISILRSYEMSANIILQSRAQLEKIYDKAADIISDNCDTLLFLGGKGTKTLEDISKLLGKETIGQLSESSSRGTQKSDGTNYQRLGRELLTPAEIALLKRGKCICHITGVPPFLSGKYDITKHKRYRLLADADKRNAYIPSWVGLSAPPADDEEFYCEEVEGS